MRNQKRNEKTFYYRLYTGRTEIDVGGVYTGEYSVTYGSPVAMKANISSAKGAAQAEQFGTDLTYDKVIVMCEPNTDIDENTVLYIDRVPTYDEQGNVTNDYDYIVKRVARSLNSVSIAIAKVR